MSCDNSDHIVSTASFCKYFKLFLCTLKITINSSILYSVLQLVNYPNIQQLFEGLLKKDNPGIFS